MIMSSEEFDYTMAKLYKPVIADMFRKIEFLIGELGDAAIEKYGADPDEVKALLEDFKFNKDGWWD